MVTNMFESVRRGKQYEIHLPNLQMVHEAVQSPGASFPGLYLDRWGKPGRHFLRPY